jgi:surface polysaccharide O-acyltransferase-like enzyme
MHISLQQSNQLKALAILMMLFMHLFQTNNYQNLFEPLIFIGSQPLSYYFALFADACVPIFCFVSGYGLFFKYQKQPQTYIKSNIKRIGKLYINLWIILLLFVVLLGTILEKDGFPGNWQRFILNFFALDTSYNGAWWFFFTYILLVFTSPLFFRLLKSSSSYGVMIVSLVFYVLAFYFRVYKPNLFEAEILNWIQRQAALFGTSFLPFIVGAVAFKGKWNALIHSFIEYVTKMSSLF